MFIYRNLLRLWLTIASLIGLILGWSLISQTSEPKTNITNTSGQTLTFSMPSIPSVDDLEITTGESKDIQTFTITQNQSGSMPQLRTGGS